MKKEEFTKKNFTLTDKDLISSIWLDWSCYYDQDELLEREIINVYKIRTIKTSKCDLVLGKVDLGSVLIDYTKFLENLEEGNGDPSTLILFTSFENNSLIKSGELISNIESEDIQINNNIYKKILEIMYAGDCSVLTDEIRFKDLKKFLKSYSFEPKRRVV